MDERGKARGSEPVVVDLPTPYPVGRVNAYLLRGETPTLVDAGVRSSRSAAELEQKLGAEGVRLEELDLVLVTHPHFDHAGAAVDLAARAGAPVRCHPEAVRDEIAGRRTFLDLLAAYGAPADLPAQIEATWTYGDRFGRPLVEAADLRPLEDGERLRAGDLEIEVLSTPGHSPGHLCYLARELGLLLCGDLLLATVTPNPLPHFDAAAPRGRRPTLRLYLDSLARVEALGPLVGLPGHGARLPDTAEAVRTARGHVLARSAELLDLVRANPDASVFELARLHFGEPSAVGQALAFCEILAHVDLLEDEGGVEVDQARGTARAL